MLTGYILYSNKSLGFYSNISSICNLIMIYYWENS
nr:MAG TPA: hypothetical protein [Caudoviricetes sp.]